jgi:hypothetical protein
MSGVESTSIPWLFSLLSFFILRKYGMKKKIATVNVIATIEISGLIIEINIPITSMAGAAISDLGKNPFCLRFIEIRSMKK